MGPRLFSRGDHDSDVVPVVGLQASMGPRLFSRGDLRGGAGTHFCQSGFNGAAAVQPRRCETLPCQFSLCIWASMGPRLFSRGDSRSGAGGMKGWRMLQWGRGCSAAEI